MSTVTVLNEPEQKRRRDMFKMLLTDTGTAVFPEPLEPHEYLLSETGGSREELTFPTLRGVVEEPDETSIFHDGDALIVSLPAVIELRVFVKMSQAINNVPWRSISYILLDFSRVERLGITGVATFYSLERIAQEQNIRLLILDVPEQIREQLDMLLPDAVCITN